MAENITHVDRITRHDRQVIRRVMQNELNAQIDCIVPILVKQWIEQLPGEPVPYFRGYLHWFSPQLLVKSISRTARDRKRWNGSTLSLFWHNTRRFRLKEIARQKCVRA